MENVSFYNNFVIPSHKVTESPTKKPPTKPKIGCRGYNYVGFNSFFRKKLGSLDNSTIANDENLLAKVLKYVKSLSPAKKEKDSKNWANRFAGAWKDDRSAEEIISGIRECRTTNSREIEISVP